MRTSLSLIAAMGLVVPLSLLIGESPAQQPHGGAPTAAMPIDPMALPGDFVDATQDTQLHVPLGTPAGMRPERAPHRDSTPTPLLALATEAAQIALETCAKDGYPVSVAVTDAAGHLKAALVADGVLPNRIYMALRKDLTVTAFHMSTLALRAKIEADPTLRSQVKPAMALLPGGMPLMAGDQLVGAIAVSGAYAAEEEKCASAGIARIQSQLR